MISTKTAKMKINLLNYEYSACLFVYDKIEVENENEFLTYVNEIFKKSKVEKFGARLIVKAPALQYTNNKIFLKDIYDHTEENHIVIFKNKKLIAYTPLEEVLKIYKKTKEKLD
jgi:hypothetical protein